MIENRDLSAMIASERRTSRQFCWYVNNGGVGGCELDVRQGRRLWNYNLCVCHRSKIALHTKRRESISAAYRIARPKQRLFKYFNRLADSVQGRTGGRGRTVRARQGKLFSFISGTGAAGKRLT